MAQFELRILLPVLPSVGMMASKSLWMDIDVMLSEYLAPGELSSLDELKAGCGAVVGGVWERSPPIATIRAGFISIRRPAPMRFETCWDCPCHGSLFDISGQPVNTRAIGPLAKVKA